MSFPSSVFAVSMVIPSLNHNFTNLPNEMQGILLDIKKQLPNQVAVRNPYLFMLKSKFGLLKKHPHPLPNSRIPPDDESSYWKTLRIQTGRCTNRIFLRLPSFHHRTPSIYISFLQTNRVMSLRHIRSPGLLMG